MQDDLWDDMALVGIVARAHGRRGHIIVDPVTDFPETRFHAGNTLYTMVNDISTALCITDTRFQRGRPVVSFDRIATLAEAEQLRGGELRVPEAMLRELPENMYYTHELIGCHVHTLEGQRIGEVREVQGPRQAQRLIVVGEHHEVDIPLVEMICVSIDVEDGTIRVDLPEGLLELNRTRLLVEGQDL